MADIEPTPPADAPAAEADQADQADQDKSELVAAAIARGIPSYEAWALTPDELAKRLES